MEFLDTIHSKKDDNKKPVGSNILDCVKQAIELKEPMTFKDFVSSNDSCKERLGAINKAKSSKDDKALVTALLNKYKDLSTNKKTKSECCSHIDNMLNDNKLTDGGMKYLLQRLCENNIDENKENKDVKQPEGAQPEEENGQPEVAESEAQEEGGESAPADTENSDLNFFDVWESYYTDKSTELTEDDFADLINEDEVNEMVGDKSLKNKDIVSNSRTTSEIKKNKVESNKALKFLKSKKLDMAKNSAYANWDRNTMRDNYNKKVEEHNTKLIGSAVLPLAFGLSAIAGSLVRSGYKGAKSYLVNRKLRKEVSTMNKELENSFTNDKQLDTYTYIMKLMKKGKYLKTVNSYLENNKDIYDKYQYNKILLNISLYGQMRKDKKEVTLLKSIVKSLKTGITVGVGTSILKSIFIDPELIREGERLSKAGNAFKNNFYSSLHVAEDFITDKMMGVDLPKGGSGAFINFSKK